MQRSLVLAVLGFLLAAPALMAQEGANHVEVGAFAEYFNLSRTSPHINFVGVGGRAAFNVRSNVQIEAEMAYDFERNFTTTFSDGITTQFVDTRLRTLHALFGPKFGNV
jgi:curli biogenesis system outer membrane secretion channel CsgG